MHLPALPHSLAAIAANYTITCDAGGESPCDVYTLLSAAETLFLKTSARPYRGTTYGIDREYAVMQWLGDKLPVPQAVHFASDEHADYLLMEQAQGKPIYHGGYTEPEKTVETYVQFLTAVQSVDITDCPLDSGVEKRLTELEFFLQHGLTAEDDFTAGDPRFSTPAELFKYLQNNIPEQKPVFSHGDPSDGNIFVDEQGVCGLIDWGRGGIADRWLDIAYCVRSIRDDLGEQHEKLVALFFDLLGEKPDWEKIEYFLLLDELF